jgi:hypothetical protein
MSTPTAGLQTRALGYVVTPDSRGLVYACPFGLSVFANAPFELVSCVKRSGWFGYVRR